MPSYCSQQTGEAKSEIFRKALKAYYENAKYVKTALTDEEEEYEDYGLDHISLKRTISCPHCGAAKNMDFEEDCDRSSDERQMGPEITYFFDWEDCECVACHKKFRVHGHISEYSMGAYNYEEINVEEE